MFEWFMEINDLVIFLFSLFLNHSLSDNLSQFISECCAKVILEKALEIHASYLSGPNPLKFCNRNWLGDFHLPGHFSKHTSFNVTVCVTPGIVVIIEAVT